MKSSRQSVHFSSRNPGHDEFSQFRPDTFLEGIDFSNPVWQNELRRRFDAGLFSYLVETRDLLDSFLSKYESRKSDSGPAEKIPRFIDEVVQGLDVTCRDRLPKLFADAFREGLDKLPDFAKFSAEKSAEYDAGAALVRQKSLVTGDLDVEIARLYSIEKGADARALARAKKLCGFYKSSSHYVTGLWTDEVLGITPDGVYYSGTATSNQAQVLENGDTAQEFQIRLFRTRRSTVAPYFGLQVDFRVKFKESRERPEILKPLEN